ncbi:SAF domain-containing protein [Xylanimonas sp. McL0601]|uniref:SAF domain-containing protein n=1 Tax=Xylanimonas sp. McL0601 TaxID=3414739 RepID=UPI003CEF1893
MSPTDPRSPRALARRRRARAARRWLWRARHVVVAVCCGVAAISAVQALRPAPPPVRDVVVSTHRLAAGVEVRRTDLEVRSVPAGLVPADVVADPAEVIGHVPAVPLAAGLPLSAELLAGGAVAALAPAGTVVVPVRLDAATADLLRPGDRVDLVSTASGASGVGEATGLDPRYLARRALVLPPASRRKDGGGGGGLLGGTTGRGTDGEVTLLAVTHEEAPLLSATSRAGEIAAVLVP